MITQSELKDLVYYEPDTGNFIAKKPRGKLKIGNILGNKNHDGYMRIKINYTHYSSHRLAWLYVYGKFPDNEIDHINRIKNDNRLINLREASTSQNGINKSLTKRNTSNFKGVTFNKKANKWQAQATLNKKTYYLGIYQTKEEAYKAYVDFAKKNHGEFLTV